MTTLAEMRSEVAREHGWHEDDDGDRIDEVLNERFAPHALELYSALERSQKILDRLARPKDGISKASAMHAWAEVISVELDARNTLSKARQS